MNTQSRYWKESVINLKNGVPLQITFSKPVNCLIVKNPSTTHPIRLGLFSVTPSSYDATAQMDGYGFLVRPNIFSSAWLVAEDDMNNVKIFETMESNITLLLPQMGDAPAGGVHVLTSVGLKPSDLNINPSTKNLVVDATFPGSVSVGSTVGLKPGDISIDANKKIGVITDGLKPATIPTILSISLTSNSVIYDYTFPINTKKIFLAVREGDDALKISLDSSLTDYLSIPSGGSYYVEGINLLSDTKFYFQSITNSKNLQIEYWV